MDDYSQAVFLNITGKSYVRTHNDCISLQKTCRRPSQRKKSQNVGADGHEVLSLTKELLVKIYFCFKSCVGECICVQVCDSYLGSYGGQKNVSIKLKLIVVVSFLILEANLIFTSSPLSHPLVGFPSGFLFMEIFIYILYWFLYFIQLFVLMRI